MSSSLTKEQLKAELVNMGVSLPPSGSKKEEYEKLYKQYAKNTGDFSSDEERPPTPVDKSKPTRRSRSISSVKATGSRGTPTTTASPSNPDALTEAEIRMLTDAELYERLTQRGLPGGPVVASTRLIYEKMLYDHMHGVARGHANGANGVENGNGFSSEEEFVIRRPSASRKSQSGTPKDQTRAAAADTSVKPPDTPLSSTPGKGLWRDADRTTPIKRPTQPRESKLNWVPTRVSSSTPTYKLLETGPSPPQYYNTSAGQESARFVEKQNIDKPVEENHSRFGMLVFVGLALLVLLIAVYYSMLNPELTEEQKILQGMEAALKEASAAQQQQ